MKPVAPRAQNVQDPATKPHTLLVAVMAALRPLASEPRMGQGHLCNNVLPRSHRWGAGQGTAAQTTPLSTSPHKTHCIACSQSLSQGNGAAGEMGRRNGCSQPGKP